MTKNNVRPEPEHVEELKSCPFCGKKVRCALINGGFHFLKCKNPHCGAVVSFDNDFYNADEKNLVAAWNRRAGRGGKDAGCDQSDNEEVDGLTKKENTEIKITTNEDRYRIDMKGDGAEIIHGAECLAAKVFLMCIDQNYMDLDAFLADFMENTRIWVELMKGVKR